MNTICHTIIKTSVITFCVFASLAVNGQRTPAPQHSEVIKIQGVIGHPGQLPMGEMAASLPPKELIRKTTFFKGDSLTGFDYSATAIQLEKDGYKLLGEFSVMMYRAQVDFVKNKYNLLSQPDEFKKTYTPPVALASSCNNLDFEDGDFNTWTATSGINQNSNGNLTLKGPAWISTDQDIYSCNDVNLITPAYGNDPIGFPGVYPNGGSYSARVGGFNINVSSGYNFGCASSHWTNGSYSNGEVIEKSYAVTAGNDLLSYNYAVVLNDGGHPNGQQPYFHVYIKDLSGNVLSTCTQYYVQAPAGSPPVGFSNSGYVNTFDNSIVYYKGWTSNSINLSAYIGQTVKVSFVSAGCTAGAHPGWAYVDATCAAAQILTSNSTPCNGSTVTLTAPPVQDGSYTWAGSGIVGAATNQTAIVSTSGTYSVTVVPSQGAACAYTLEMPVTFNSPAVTANSTTATCSLINGTATANASAGTPNYTYAWSAGSQTTQTAVGLAGGTYTVTVSDAIGCSGTTTVSVAATSNPTISGTSTTDAGCSVSNGTATANPSGGTPGYNYSWIPGSQTTQTATSLSGGDYTVTVTDINGCTVVATASVGITLAPTVTANSNQSTCGNSNGYATANPSGGTPGYTYLWNNGQTTQIATGLGAGIYTITITDANGCTANITTNVSNANGPTSTTSVNGNVLCSGGDNGSATANTSGGTPGYLYNWSNGQTTSTATGLSAGNYNVTVSDANGCIVVASVTISEPSILTTSTVATPILCYGGTALASVTPSGGTPGYSYSWSSGQTTTSIAGIVSGNYSVTITDANGCITTNTLSITEPSALASSTTQSAILCNGGTATASATASDGTPGYSYSWSNGQTTSAITGISAGNYSVIVTDANGCTKTNTLSITAPAALTSPTTQSTILCNGATATASTTPSGGTPGYSYSWSNGLTTSAIAGISAGNYTVTVTDANGCTSQSILTITQPEPLSLSVSGNNNSCLGENNVLTAIPLGGTPNYTYVWNPGAFSENSITVNPTSSTTYSVAITDGNGCISTTVTYSVSILPLPTALFDTTSHGLYSTLSSFTDLSTDGISWLWDFGDGTTSTQQNPVHTFPGAGIYTVTQVVTNQFGCTDTFTIIFNFEIEILIPNVFTPDGNGINDVWYIPNSGVEEFHVEIFDRWGLKVFESSDDEIRWDGHSTGGKLLADGTYYFVLTAILKSSDGDKDYSTNGHVSLLTTKRD